MLIHFPYSEPNNYFLVACDEQRKESLLCDTCCAIFLFIYLFYTMLLLFVTLLRFSVNV